MVKTGPCTVSSSFQGVSKVTVLTTVIGLRDSTPMSLLPSTAKRNREGERRRYQDTTLLFARRYLLLENYDSDKMNGGNISLIFFLSPRYLLNRSGKQVSKSVLINGLYLFAKLPWNPSLIMPISSNYHFKLCFKNQVTSGTQKRAHNNFTV